MFNFHVSELFLQSSMPHAALLVPEILSEILENLYELCVEPQRREGIGDPCVLGDAALVCKTWFATARPLSWRAVYIEKALNFLSPIVVSPDFRWSTAVRCTGSKYSHSPVTETK